MPSNAALFRLTRLAMSAVDTATPIDKPFAFTEFDPGAVTEMIDLGRDLGGLGSLSHHVDNTRANRKLVRPSMALKPSVAEWAELLQWIMYGTPTGITTKTYPLGDREVPRAVAFDDTRQDWLLTGVAVDRAVFAAQAGGELGLRLECAGVDYSHPGTFPGGLDATPTPASPRLLMGDLAVTLNGVSNVKCRSATLTVSHSLNADRFFYGFTSAGPVNTDRQVTVELDLPLGLHLALADAGAVDAGVPLTLTFSYGGKVLAFSMPAVRTPTRPVRASAGEAELFVPWQGTAFVAAGGAANSELSTTLTL